MQPNLESLIEAARRLPLSDRRRLVDAITDSRIARTIVHRITEIRGVGKDIRTNIDAKEYIDSERNSWEN